MLVNTCLYGQSLGLRQNPQKTIVYEYPLIWSAIVEPCWTIESDGTLTLENLDNLFNSKCRRSSGDDSPLQSIKETSIGMGLGSQWFSRLQIMEIQSRSSRSSILVLDGTWPLFGIGLSPRALLAQYGQLWMVVSEHHSWPDHFPCHLGVATTWSNHFWMTSLGIARSC